MEDISSGKLKPGERLPTEKELCETFGVSRITSKKAMEMLSDQGIIYRLPGKGSFVSESVGSRLGTKRGDTIAYLTPDFNDAFGVRLLSSIEKTCVSLGYHLILRLTRDSVEEERKAISALGPAEAKGILLMPAHGEYYNEEILRQIIQHRPIVFVDRTMRGLSAPSVTTDNAAASELGMEYLLRLGHRNIAFYSGPIENTSTVEERRRGFIQAFANYGITLDTAFFCSLGVEGGEEFMKRQLREHPEITAVFASEYFFARMVKRAAASLGRSVPEDLSILTMDCPESAVSSSLSGEAPEFTYLKQDEEEIGRLAVESLHRVILGEDPPSDIHIPARLVTGASVAPVE